MRTGNETETWPKHWQNWWGFKHQSRCAGAAPNKPQVPAGASGVMSMGCLGHASTLTEETQMSLNRTIQNGRTPHPIKVMKQRSILDITKSQEFHTKPQCWISASFWRGSAKIRCFKLCWVFNLLLKYTLAKLSKHKRFPLEVIFFFFFWI